MRVLALIVIGMLMLGCAAQPVRPTDPVCDRPEFAESWICTQLRANGIEDAEIVRDLILDANDIALITEAYTPEELKRVLDQIEGFLQNGLSYSVFMNLVIDKTHAKAQRISSIIRRRFNVLQSPEAVRASDVKLIRMAIAALRESV